MHDMRYSRQVFWVVATGLTAFPAVAWAQQAPPARSESSGVLSPPADVDPGIQAKPPVSSSKLPTTVIPPPGTSGGDPSTQAK